LAQTTLDYQNGEADSMRKSKAALDFGDYSANASDQWL
jgi:hypothetical protein